MTLKDDQLQPPFQSFLRQPRKPVKLYRTPVDVGKDCLVNSIVSWFRKIYPSPRIPFPKISSGMMSWPNLKSTQLNGWGVLNWWVITLWSIELPPLCGALNERTSVWRQRTSVTQPLPAQWVALKFSLPERNLPILLDVHWKRIVWYQGNHM